MSESVSYVYSDHSCARMHIPEPNVVVASAMSPRHPPNCLKDCADCADLDQIDEECQETASESVAQEGQLVEVENGTNGNKAVIDTDKILTADEVRDYFKADNERPIFESSLRKEVEK